MKKYFLALLALVSTVYAVHTWTMTETEEQPFLDEEKTEQPEENLFIEKVKQFFTSNDESKIEPAASAETVLEGSRPYFAERQSATRSVIPSTSEDSEKMDQNSETENLNLIESSDSDAEPLLEEDFLTTGSSIIPETEESISLSEDEQTSETPSIETDIEDLGMTSPDELLEDETELQEINAPAHPEPEIDITQEINPAPKSIIQKEVAQFKKEAIQGIE